jgi:hypothetical protein
MTLSGFKLQKASAGYPRNMSSEYSRLYKIGVSSGREDLILRRLKARIDAYNRKDKEAVARGRDERTKWLLTNREVKDIHQK